MKPINQVYPEHAQDELANRYFSGPSDYAPLLESMGYGILLRVDDEGYQGDSRLILRDGPRYGVLIFGWGSCSGCDALQACQSMREIEELREKLNSDIKWFETRAETLSYFKTHRWEDDYGWCMKETRQFVAEGKRILADPEQRKP
jgi:hypothetical protein